MTVVYCRGDKTVSLNYGHHPACCSSPDDTSMKSLGGMILTGENRKTRRKTCPDATLSTTNSTWIDPGSNPGFRRERTAANRQSRNTASQDS
jgi:hypothetical protein